MRAFFESIIKTDSIRYHPWTTSVHDPEGKYYDFKKHPELIRTSLEEFTPYDKYQAIEECYQLIEWLNGSDSFLETNDARLEPNVKNPNYPTIDRRLVLSSSISVLFRNLDLNLSSTISPPNEWLIKTTESRLDGLPNPLYGVVKLYLFPTKFMKATLDARQQLGHSVIYKILAWGNAEAEQFENFHQVVKNLSAFFKALETPP
jgi:hypothetical protein